MKKKRMTVIAALVGAAVAASVFSPLLWPRVYAGVTVDGVDVGGIGRAEVYQILLLWQKEQQERRVAVYYGDTRFEITADAIDFVFDADATLEEVWGVGRRGVWWERLKNIYLAAAGGYRVPVRFRYNETKLANLLEQWRETIDRPPRNATVSLLTGGIIPQEPGRKLETEALRPLLLKALRSPDVKDVAMPVTPVYPEITVADLQRTGIRENLSRFTTVFDPKDTNRTANIRLAARKINGHIVYPGQTFSFNETVGPREKAYGFKEALEIVDGEFVPGVGGGVCQVSSTLYNAVLLANLPVVERSNHSKPLGYVGLGRDATVAYGVLDFKFSNSTNGPIMIMAEVEGDKLHVGIFGQERRDETVEVLAAERKVIPPAIIKKQDQDMFLGETRMDKQGKPGYEVTTIRVVRRNGQEVKREILAKDRYLPENTIVKVGVKLPPFAQSSGQGDKEKRTGE
ncbi:VanW family protein [Sporolituus thermophilus]|uniref:Vancomycin resistance protein YoaR, contains peptidoglycan-binding and VanW domains n=1 Tax=Sporolituus thermophilus DSM 23256 TaxID=1123285 RepID=A0A1G7PHS6_9FIRM|nr:VanW family protein [Sporolituus thermophilus]SDF85791.1 Vancomycin resistance protein YoaR, contains peptidoglycan-binding and VanW domains [Sporolituus thermophilus DSM 23256]